AWLRRRSRRGSGQPAGCAAPFRRAWRPSRSGQFRRTPRAPARALSSCPGEASRRVGTDPERVRVLESRPPRGPQARTAVRTVRAWIPKPRALSRAHRLFASNPATDAGVHEAACAYPSAVYPPACTKETTPLILGAFLSWLDAGLGSAGTR